MRTVIVALTEAEASALAHVIRRLSPEAHGVEATAWYGALDKLSPQLGIDGADKLDGACAFPQPYARAVRAASDLKGSPARNARSPCKRRAREDRRPHALGAERTTRIARIPGR